MRILVNLFFLSKIGGVLTFHNNLVNGLKKLGHEVEECYISKNTKIINPKIIKRDIGLDIAHGYESDILFNNYKKFATNFDPDMVLFSHPSPTETSKYKSRNWQRIFKLHGNICHVVFHEPLNNRQWIGEVDDCITSISAVAEKGILGVRNIKKFDNRKIEIIHHPVSFEDDHKIKLKLKRRCSISPHQYKSWKHTDLQVRAAPKFDHKMYFTSSGTEYFYMAGSIEKRKEAYKNESGEWIWDKAIEADKIKYLGVLPGEKMIELYERAMCMVDMSTGENGTRLDRMYKNESKKSGTPQKRYKSLNFGVFGECCKYGVVPIMREYWSKTKILEKWESDCKYESAIWIPEKNIIKNIANAVNDVTNDFEKYRKTIVYNIKNAKKYLSDHVVANRIIKQFNEQK